MTMSKDRFTYLVDELKLQINFAVISINHFNQITQELNNLNYDQAERRVLTYEFWYYLQNYIVSLANISKILYSVYNNRDSRQVNASRKKERAFLRRTLNIPDKTTLENKDMRNILEHIDENIEKFADSNPGFILNRNIGPTNMFGTDKGSLFENDINNLRNFLTDKRELILFGKRFNIDKTLEEVLSFRDIVINIEKDLNDGLLDYIFEKRADFN